MDLTRTQKIKTVIDYKTFPLVINIMNEVKAIGYYNRIE